MPRVIGIDPGTVSIDLCGLDNGRLFLDRSWPTAEALPDPARFVAELEAAGPLDLVVGPSGYGVPITRAQDVTEEAPRLAFLAAPGETGGIGGLRNLVRALARTALPVVLTPGVVRSEEHTSELQSPYDLVCRLLLEKKKNKQSHSTRSLPPAAHSPAPPIGRVVPPSRATVD